jgi:uncharacterized protein YrrD
MDAAALRGREIVSVQEAHKLGKVREVLFETQPLRVAALKASGDDGEFIIALGHISRFGPDAVMVESPSVREIAREARESERTLEELTHLKVVDEDGQGLGTVRSIEFDPENGEVLRLTSGEGGMLGMGGMTATIRAAGIRGVGTDLLTVASSEHHDDDADDTDMHDPRDRDRDRDRVQVYRDDRDDAGADGRPRAE